MQPFQPLPRLFSIILASLTVAWLPAGFAQQCAKPYKVTIVEDKPEIAEGLLPIAADDQIRLEYIYNRDMIFGLRADGKRVANSVQPLFMIDGTPAAPKDMAKLQALPQVDSWKVRHGGQTVWQQGEIRVTMILEAIAGKPSQPQPGVPVVRRLDTLLVKYIIENVGEIPHRVACRTVVDTKVVGNDGALFVAPTTHPQQILNGVASPARSCQASWRCSRNPIWTIPASRESSRSRWAANWKDRKGSF